METKLEIIELFMVQGQGLELMENHGEENGQANGIWVYIGWMRTSKENTQASTL